MAEVIKKFDARTECPHCHETIGYNLEDVPFWEEAYDAYDVPFKRTFKGDLTCPNCGKDFTVRHSGIN